MGFWSKLINGPTLEEMHRDPRWVKEREARLRRIDAETKELFREKPKLSDAAVRALLSNDNPKRYER